ncbi:hypothetical protein Sjap_010235 [Stephania japonica]|uniref:FG-GAP repeat-containing protein n=1 Tax=Stephania japonica TaxID=461633 RepID=A0AAP0J977_9MAGN
MRKRDLAILLLSAFAIFFTLQHEGDFSFKEAWFHLSDDYPIKYEAERLPPPIVADLNGDGRSEVLVATHDAKIQVLTPHARRVDEGFSESRVIAEVSLLPDKVRVSSGRRAVAMATGFVDRVFKHGTPRKQVLVVVTSGWSVMCFDHNLKKLWESNFQEDFPHGAHHREIAISITNYTLKHSDAGLVIVGGRMEMQPHIFMDPFEEIGEELKNSEKHRRSASEKEASDHSGTVDLRHFAFYAFAGRTGTLRWSRKTEVVFPPAASPPLRKNRILYHLLRILLSQNIQLHSSDAPQLIPQHNYKLDVHALNSRQPGEFECREFRESILGVMPHRWDRREDTSFELAHFRRHKRKSLKKTPGKSSNYPFDKPEENHPPGKDTTNKIPKLIGKAKNYAGSAKTKKRSPYVPTITNYTQFWWVPNVVVAHQKEGIEAVHLASGRTVCKDSDCNPGSSCDVAIVGVEIVYSYSHLKGYVVMGDAVVSVLHLQEGGLHADINGDGVLDHVQCWNIPLKVADIIYVYCITISPIVETAHPSSVNCQPSAKYRFRFYAFSSPVQELQDHPRIKGLTSVITFYPFTFSWFLSKIWSKQQSISFPESSLFPVVGSNGAEQTVVSGSMEVLRPCWAVATSGVPVREQLFNASICHHYHFNLFHGRAMEASSLEVATPILVQTKDGHRHRKGSHGDVVFLTNRGEVTSYAPGLHGHGADWRWQLLTGATWSNLPSPAGMMEAGIVVPTLKVFSLSKHDHQEVILAAGDQEAVVLSPGGSQLATLELPAPPTHALICEDFSNDGLTDIILVTSNGVYGFVQTRQPGALFFSTLLDEAIIRARLKSGFRRRLKHRLSYLVEVEMGIGSERCRRESLTNFKVVNSFKAFSVYDLNFDEEIAINS